jgi:hypothetical protein
MLCAMCAALRVRQGAYDFLTVDEAKFEDRTVQYRLMLERLIKRQMMISVRLIPEEIIGEMKRETAGSLEKFMAAKLREQLGLTEEKALEACRAIGNARIFLISGTGIAFGTTSPDGRVILISDEAIEKWGAQALIDREGSHTATIWGRREAGEVDPVWSGGCSAVRLNLTVQVGPHALLTDAGYWLARAKGVADLDLIQVCPLSILLEEVFVL